MHHRGAPRVQLVAADLVHDYRAAALSRLSEVLVAGELLVVVGHVSITGTGRSAVCVGRRRPPRTEALLPQTRKTRCRHFNAAIYTICRRHLPLRRPIRHGTLTFISTGTSAGVRPKKMRT